MFHLFTDPVLRAPTIGCMLIGLAAGLIGCLVFLQKRSLVGETLSHATYPGVVLGALVGAGFSLPLFLGGAVTSLLGLFTLHFMEKRMRISSDAALCFVLSIFFGVGILIASYMQTAHPLWYRQVQTTLFGQAATLVDGHIAIFAVVALSTIGCATVFYRYFQILHFDRDFAKSVGMRITLIDAITQFFLVAVIIAGMRSVGVVLMTAILISPAAAARFWCKDLKSFFLISALFGMSSGFLGNVVSLYLPQESSFPTGPMIVLSSAAFCIFSLIFAPKKGLFPRWLRLKRFRSRSYMENILKALYKNTPIRKSFFALNRMKQKGWIRNGKLSEKGMKEAEKLIRLHRLWELYLVHLGQGAERVHASAEEMEHILTPDIEKQLQKLLNYPKKDPINSRYQMEGSDESLFWRKLF